MMLKSGPKAIKEFTSAAYNQFGVRLVILATFLDGEGHPSISL
jgi:hypothetical protein